MINPAIKSNYALSYTISLLHLFYYAQKAGGFVIELVDSHCHLDFADFNRDRIEVLTRAQANGNIF